MLFDVFSHSFFNPEGELSAAELLMMFHFYFTGNAEGLIFDVVRRPLTAAIWQPFLSWLRARGVLVLTDTTVERVERATGEWRVVHSQVRSPGTTPWPRELFGAPIEGLRPLISEPVYFRKGLSAFTDPGFAEFLRRDKAVASDDLHPA